MWADWSSCIFESCGDGSKDEIVEGLRKREKRIPEQYGGKTCEPLIVNGKNIYQSNLVLPKTVQVIIVLFQVIVTLIWYSIINQ